MHAMQALSRTVSKHTPTRKRGGGLNFALLRSIHQKGSQLHPASRNHAPPTRQFYHPIFKCVNGFCSERRSFTRKVFSDSLLSAILILHIKVALFIFPKSIDKEVFSTMPIYYRCFLSVNQPVVGGVRVADKEEQRRFFVPQLIKLQLVIRHDLPKLGNIKGSQSCTAGNQDAFGCLARDKLSRTF